MPGRQGPEGHQQDPLDRSATSGYRFSEMLEKRRTEGTGAYRFSELTGRQPVVPKRPPGMSPHLDGPPPTPRVARPPQEVRKPRTLRWWVGALVIFLVGGTLLWVVANGAINLFLAVSASAGPANTAGNFLADLQTANYDQAYTELDPTITVQLSNSDFKQMAQADDQCYGKITDYLQIEGSAASAGQNIQSFAYNVTRSKLKKTYRFELTLQKNAGGNWLITNFGGDLGPSAPTC